MSLPLAAIYSMACVCLGVRLLRFVLGERSPAETCGRLGALSSAFLLGQGVLAGVWLLIGLVGWFKTPVVAAVVMACVLVGWHPAKSLILHTGSALGGHWRQMRADGWAWRLLGYLLAAQIVVMGLSALFMPPRGDAGAFYMTLPKYMAHYERLVPQPNYATFSQVGLQGEMHFAALMSLGSESAAKGFVWPTSLAAVGMLLATGGLAGLKRRGKWVAAVMYFTSTAVTLISVDAKVDLFAAAMGLAAIYWALHTCDGGIRWRAACLCGLFTGLAAVAKFSYMGALVPCVFVLLLWRCFSVRCGRPAPWRAILTPLGVLAVWGICAFAAAVPHLVKNWVLFDQPLAPFVGGETWHVQDWFHGAKGDHVVRWIHLTYPLAVFFGDYGMQYGTLSPLILAMFPLVVLSWRGSRPLRSTLLQVMVAAVFGLVVFTVLSPRVFAPRYVLAPMLIVILPAALGAQIVLDSRRGGVLTAAILAAMVLVTAGRLGLDASRGGRDAGKYAWGRFVDPSRLPPDCGAAEALNARAARDESVILASYYCYWVRPDLIRNHVTADRLARYRCYWVLPELVPSYDAPEQPAPVETPSTARQRCQWLYDDGIRRILLDTRSFGVETGDAIVVYPHKKGGSTGLLSTAEVPETLEVNVPYRWKERIVLDLRARR